METYKLQNIKSPSLCNSSLEETEFWKTFLMDRKDIQDYIVSHANLYFTVSTVKNDRNAHGSSSTENNTTFDSTDVLYENDSCDLSAADNPAEDTTLCTDSTDALDERDRTTFSALANDVTISALDESDPNYWHIPAEPGEETTKCVMYEGNDLVDRGPFASPYINYYLAPGDKLVQCPYERSHHIL